MGLLNDSTAARTGLMIVTGVSVLIKSKSEE